MMRKKKMIILSGPSGCGKTTIAKFLLSKIPELKLSVSCTTRKIRKNEIHGKDYFFLSKKNFLSKIKKNKFIEWEEVYENLFYGTLKNEVYKIWKEKKYALFDIDVKGCINLKNKYINNSLSIFIKINSKNVLKKRLINRNSENKKNINFRLQRMEKENHYSNFFDYVINNKNLKITSKKIINLVNEFLFKK